MFNSVRSLRHLQEVLQVTPLFTNMDPDCSGWKTILPLGSIWLLKPPEIPTSKPKHGFPKTCGLPLWNFECHTHFSGLGNADRTNPVDGRNPLRHHLRIPGMIRFLCKYQPKNGFNHGFLGGAGFVHPQYVLGLSLPLREGHRIDVDTCFTFLGWCPASECSEAPRKKGTPPPPPPYLPTRASASSENSDPFFFSQLWSRLSA